MSVYIDPSRVLKRVTWAIMVAALSFGLCAFAQTGSSESGSSHSKLTWDSTVKEYSAQAGEGNKLFAFEVTNFSDREVVIKAVTPACGCTLIKTPPLPWKLATGEKGRIEASMDWSGRYGLFSKDITVETSEGSDLLTLKISIPKSDETREIPLNRARNMQAAQADRQAVFKHDCARCHASPANGKFGKELYSTACAICHDAKHRASMVPDLKALTQPTGAAFWRQWIEHGKAGSLMPAFASSEGGPLSNPQIDSLVEYLNSMVPDRTGDQSKKPTAE